MMSEWKKESFAEIGFGAFVSLSIFCQALPFLIRFLGLSAPCAMNWDVCIAFNVKLSYFVGGHIMFPVCLGLTIVYLIVGARVPLALSCIVVVLPFAASIISGIRFGGGSMLNCYLYSAISLALSLLFRCLLKSSGYILPRIGGGIMAIGTCLVLPTRGLYRENAKEIVPTQTLRGGLAPQSEGGSRVIAIVGDPYAERCRVACFEAVEMLKKGGYFSFHYSPSVNGDTGMKKAILLEQIHLSADSGRITEIMTSDESGLDKLLMGLNSSEIMKTKLDFVRDVSMLKRSKIPKNGGMYICEPFEECKLNYPF